MCILSLLSNWGSGTKIGFYKILLITQSNGKVKWIRNDGIFILIETDKGLVEMNKSILFDEENEACCYDEYIGDLGEGTINFHFKTSEPVFGVLLWNIYSIPS